LLHAQGHAAEVVDAYCPDFFKQLDGCHGFMWWFPQMPGSNSWPKRLILALDHARNLPLFPNRQTIWHFEDKIAQHYLLQAAGIPYPQTWVLWGYNAAMRFAQTARYPLVMKLATGIMSQNVRLVRNAAEARSWINRLFGAGLFRLEHPLRSAARHLRDRGHLLVKGHLRRLARDAVLQTNYLLVQEFLPGNDFDTRITVIGHRAFGFRRWNRPGDFRASGSGRIDHRPEPIALDAVRLAFQVAHTLGTQSLAVDVLRRDGEPVLNEISYYYEGWAVTECPGHWEWRGADQLEWVEGRMRPEDAILEDFLALVCHGCTHVTAN
jgi:glutathione synthase/RimK-type ligase-like ATP-grasp enzyme